ncbi:TPA: capsular polysaccharide synthesis protein [Photobacterium damselae]
MLRILDRLYIYFKRFSKESNNIKHVVFVNWNGKYGDAIVSAPIINFLTSSCNINVSVISNESLRTLYCSVIQVDYFHAIPKDFGWLDLIKAAFNIKRCDAVVPLFGKLGIKDILFNLLLKPKVIFSTDSSLNMSSKVFIDKSEQSDVYAIYELIADIICPGSSTLGSASLGDENERCAKSYDYLINPYGSRQDKSLSLDKAKSLIAHLSISYADSSFGIMYSSDTIQSATQLVDDLGLSNVELVKEINSFDNVISIIRNAGLLISVDTSLVHISKVLDKDVVAIYPETKYFNIWQPTTSRSFEVVQSKGSVDFGDIKNMNQFENADVDYALARIKNGNRLASKKVVFLYWHSSKEDMPIGHALNIRNLESRLSGTDWVVIVTTLDKRSPDYIENYISLPPYFHHLVEKTGDPKIQHGNHSDIIRLRLLEKYGGVYLDTSTIFLKQEFEYVSLYKRLKESPYASFAGYTNVTFTRKDEDGRNHFEEAKDGIELCILYANKSSRVLEIFNEEIDKYWQWKSIDKNYRDYPPFKQFGLKNISFLNEYHIHYSIYHLIITRQPNLLSEILVESMHMVGKEESNANGPYALTDLFCRGVSGYEPASPDLLLKCFLDGDLESCHGVPISLDDRVNIIEDMDFIKIPGYLRVSLESEFNCMEDFLIGVNLYQKLYNFCSSEISSSIV